MYKNFLVKRNNKLSLLGGKPLISSKLKPYKTIGLKEFISISDVMKSGYLSGFIGAWCEEFHGGPKVQELENSWKNVFKCNHAISVNSNTSGLIAALGAIGLSPGDEVIVPPMTMSASVIAPLFYGGIPVFVDIEDQFFCLDIEKVKAAISDKTKVILAVNLFGHPADLRELRLLADQKGIYLIEDSAQCPLAQENGVFAGTIGHIGIFSLNYHKHIQTGEGGICCTNDDQLAFRLKAIRNHGENIVETLDVKDATNLLGFNFRMTELSAAVGIEQLKKISKFVSNRETIANKLSESTNFIKGFQPPKVRKDCRHVYYVWAAKVNEDELQISRNTLAKALLAEGVPIEEGYCKPLYLLPAFTRRIAIGNNGWPFSMTKINYRKGLCPVAEYTYEKSLLEFCICSFQLKNHELKKVINSFHKIFDNLKDLREYEQNLK